MNYKLAKIKYIAHNPFFYTLMQLKKSFVFQGYTLKSFKETETIFIHIPKAAGMSLANAIYGNFAGSHAKVSDYRYIFAENEFDRFFKFSFVRNPWDRLYSAYSFLKKGGINSQDKNWSELNLSRYKNFEHFVMEWVSGKNIYSYIHFVPQVDFLIIPGISKIQIDYLGFFENLNDDFDYISSKIKVSNRLRHINKTISRKKTYAEMYNKDMISLVHNVYRKDIDIFGYSFDNSSLCSQVQKRNNCSLF